MNICQPICELYKKYSLRPLFVELVFCTNEMLKDMQPHSLESFAQTAEQQQRFAETLAGNGAFEKIRGQQEMFAKLMERLNI